MSQLANLKALDEFFIDNSFVYKQKLSPADYAFVSALKYVMEKEPSVAKESNKFRNLKRYLNMMTKQQDYNKVVGLKFFTSGEEKPASSKKPTASDKPAAIDNFDLMEQVAQEKPKDPWAALPPGKFDFDDFKRNFSNNPEDVSIPYFWSKFDPEHYSIWLCDYNYNDELGLTFMSCNLIGGMYQRIEKMRKAAFASMCVWGVDHKNIIAGIWVWRGHDLAFKLSENWQIDYESYSWRKLDPNAEETKQLVNTFFRREGEYKGMPYCDGKIFK